jgi:hypothetical protein
MSDLQGIEGQLRKLHDDAIADYDARLDRAQRAQALTPDREQRMRAELADFLGHPVDVHQFSVTHDDDQSNVEAYMAQERARVAEPIDKGGAERRALRAALVDAQSTVRRVPVAAATLLARDHAYLEGNPGEQGNPWVFPYDPTRAKLFAENSGHGWGCSATAYSAIQDASATFWYPFVPDRTGWWYLFPLANIHGFRVSRADGRLFSCNNSSARVVVTMDIYQYDYRAAHRQWTEVDIDEGEIHDAQRIDIYGGWGQWDCQTQLGAGDWAVIGLRFDLHTRARGHNSFSELNFRDGQANSLDPVIVATWPIGT